MLIAAGALEPSPPYAVVPEHVVASVLRDLGLGRRRRGELDRVFRKIEEQQPALAAFLTDELAEFETPATQALGYYLFLAVCSAFRSAFGERLSVLSQADLERALDLLLADGEVRSRICPAGSFSQDRVACLQPALMDAVMAELDLAHAALAKLGPKGDAADRAGEPAQPPIDVDTILQVLLVEIVALTRAVSPK